jgi:hypothetical protein
MKKIVLFLTLLLVFQIVGISQDLGNLSEKNRQYFHDFISNRKVQQQLNASPVIPRNALQNFDINNLVIEMQGDATKPNGFLKVLNDKNTLIGCLHFGRVSNTNAIINNDEWLMIWRDLSGMDDALENGTIKCYDINMNSVHFCNIVLLGGKVLDWPFFITRSNNDVGRNAGADYCDKNYGNGNGNLGFWECYNCMKGLIGHGNGTAGAAICAAAGWQCGASIGLSCTYLSWAY